MGLVLEFHSGLLYSVWEVLSFPETHMPIVKSFVVESVDNQLVEALVSLHESILLDEGVIKDLLRGKGGHREQYQKHLDLASQSKADRDIHHGNAAAVLHAASNSGKYAPAVVQKFQDRIKKHNDVVAKVGSMRKTQDQANADVELSSKAAAMHGKQALTQPKHAEVNMKLAHGNQQDAAAAQEKADKIKARLNRPGTKIG